MGGGMQRTREKSEKDPRDPEGKVESAEDRWTRHRTQPDFSSSFTHTTSNPFLVFSKNTRVFALKKKGRVVSFLSPPLLPSLHQPPAPTGGRSTKETT